MKSYWKIIIVLVIIALVGFAIYYFYKKEKSKTAQQNQPQNQPQKTTGQRLREHWTALTNIWGGNHDWYALAEAQKKYNKDWDIWQIFSNLHEQYGDINKVKQVIFNTP